MHSLCLINGRVERWLWGQTVGWLLIWSAHIHAAAPLTAETDLQPMTVTVVNAQDRRPIAGASVAASTGGSATTDERGIASLRVPRADSGSFRLYVEHTDYSARRSAWLPGSSRAALPSSYTLGLERPIGIGGFVRDEKGPVSGATVVAWTDESTTTTSGQPAQWQDYPSVPRNVAPGVITDSNGFWSRTNFPADLIRCRIDVIRPGGARTTFTTDPRMSYGGDIASEMRIDDLRATNTVLKVPDGVTIRGIVVDAQDRAITNVHLRERRGRSYQIPIYEFTNNADGRFELPHRASVQYLLAAEAAGFANKSLVVKAATEPEVRIVMLEAKPLRLRIIGDRDEPLFARVQVQQWRSENLLLYWGSQTDSDGRVTWTNAPTEPVTLSIEASNFPMRSLRFTADGSEKVVHLRNNANQRIAIKVRAVDSKMGKALDWFQVRRNAQYGDGFVTWGEPPNRSGIFETNLTSSELQRVPGRLRVQVWADGYAPWTSSLVYFDEGDQEFVATLTNAPLATGVVLQPNGQPASGTRPVLNTGSETLFMNNSGGDFYDRPGTYRVNTETNGYFTLPPAEEANRIFVRHSTGFAALTVGELLRTQEVRLQPWARIEGVLQSGGKPLANEYVSLKSPINWNSSEGYSLNILVRTDANGAFTYTNVPPGEYMFYRIPVMISGMTHTESHPWPFDLAAGETKKIDYGFGGRNVIGHIEASGVVDWQNDSHMLTLKLPDSPPQPNYYDFVDQKDFDRERKAYGKSAAVKEYDRKRRQFQLVFDRDGNFKADDVPAGTYELRIRVTRPPKDPNMRYARREEELGALVKEIVVPPGAPGEDFDLGNLEMELKGEKVPLRQLAEFKAVTLDGKPFNLETVRGKPAVLVFWAHWAPKSVARLADLRAVQESTNAPVSFITVNLDEDVTIAKFALGDFKRAIHTRLEGRALVDVAEQSGIDTLPATLVLDDQGRVIARDIEGKRLRSALERAVAKMAKK